MVAGRVMGKDRDVVAQAQEEKEAVFRAKEVGGPESPDGHPLRSSNGDTVAGNALRAGMRIGDDVSEAAEAVAEARSFSEIVRDIAFGASRSGQDRLVASDSRQRFGAGTRRGRENGSIAGGSAETGVKGSCVGGRERHSVGSSIDGGQPARCDAVDPPGGIDSPDPGEKKEGRGVGPKRCKGIEDMTPSLIGNA